MCTIVIAKDIYPGMPIVVAANRDEILDRASEPPAIRDDGIKILAPRDAVRGGFWIGVNEFGVLVGLTNRLNVKSGKGRISRGKLVADALHCRSAQEAFNLTANVPGGSYNGFYMVIADQKDFYYVGGNGHKIEVSVEKKGLLVVSNHGVGREILRDTSRRVANTLLAWMDIESWPARVNPSPEVLKSLLNIHDVERYGTCINQPEVNYGTKSSSIIQLDGDHWNYWHRERKGDEHICQEPFILQPQLAII